MVLMNLKIDNYMAFNNFEMNMSYPKKIVGNQLIEHLERHPYFRYRKLNILMGANASGKTSIGRMLLSIFVLILKREYTGITSFISDTEREATFEIQFVVADTFYKLRSIVKAKTEEIYTSSDFLTRVDKVQIKKNDTYEKCLARLEEASTGEYSNDYIRELEKIESLSWAFEFPRDSMANSRFIPDDDNQYMSILKNTLQTLDPFIADVYKVDGVEDTYVIKIGKENAIVKNGQIIGADMLSSGTKEGISLANMYAAMVCGKYEFFYCDEKFSFIHSDIEKAFLSLMVQKLQGDCQLFFTTHNTDILDMDFPKHSFNFLRKEIYGEECDISVINAGDYIKKNTDSVKNAVQNDLFSSAPMIEKIFAMDEA